MVGGPALFLPSNPSCHWLRGTLTLRLPTIIKSLVTGYRSNWSCPQTKADIQQTFPKSPWNSSQQETKPLITQRNINTKQGWRTGAEHSKRPWPCCYLVTLQKNSDALVLGWRQEDHRKKEKKWCFTIWVLLPPLNVIFQDLWTVVLLYGSLSAAHISPFPCELHAVDKLNFPLNQPPESPWPSKTISPSLTHLKWHRAAVNIPAGTFLAPYTML